MKTELQAHINDCSQQMEDIQSIISTLQPFDKMRSYLTQYALIKTCGTLEFVFKSIIADFIDQSSLIQIHTYIEKTVRNSHVSATYDNMSGLLGKFDSNWQKSFKTSIKNRSDGQRLIASANSLVTNRHLFAHGQSPTATFNDIYQYYRDTLILVNELDLIVR